MPPVTITAHFGSGSTKARRGGASGCARPGLLNPLELRPRRAGSFAPAGSDEIDLASATGLVRAFEAYFRLADLVEQVRRARRLEGEDWLGEGACPDRKPENLQVAALSSRMCCYVASGKRWH